MSRLLLVVTCFVLGVLASSAPLAQTLRPGEERPTLPDFLPPESESLSEGILPPFVLPHEPGTEGMRAGFRFRVRGFHFSGNRALPARELEPLAAEFVGEEIGIRELREVRDRVTRAYIDRGYVTSGAVLVDQDIVDGIVEIRVVEGVLERVEVTTDGRLRERYVRSRIQFDSDGVVNVHVLETRLAILQQDRRIRQVRATLVPGEARGGSILRVSVIEATQYYGSANANNSQVPAIGSYGGEFVAGHTNLTGFGDHLRAAYTVTEGLDEIEASYLFPVNRWGTAIGAHGTLIWSDVVEEPFDDFDIKGRSRTVGLDLSQTLFRSVENDAGVFATAELRRTKSFLFGSGFSFQPGPDDGIARVSVVRTGAYWTHRTRERVLAARSTFSVGLDVLNATMNDKGIPDGDFFSWLGQLQIAQRLPWLGSQVVARFDVQLTDSPLLGLEQFTIGGYETVRGYRDNQLVRDNGFAGALEVRIPVFTTGRRSFSLSLAPFVDVGRSWNEGRTVGRKVIVGAGIGVRARILEFATARFYWGHAFDDVFDPGEYDIQDDGLYFQVAVRFP